MGSFGKNSARTSVASGLLLAGAVGLLALPSAVLAFSTSYEAKHDKTSTNNTIETIDPTPAPARLARSIALRSLAKGQLYPFTPADTPNRPDRSVTVAVRVDPQTAKAMTKGGPQNGDSADADPSVLHIAPMAFNLGVSRGYHSFAQSLVPAADGHKAELPDLAHFSITPSAKSGESRFSPHIVMDEKQSAGRAPRTFAGEGDDQVDVGGSYRVAHNLDVTAGVRYSQERERLLPLTDGKQDSQAVYVGTQFRF